MGDVVVNEEIVELGEIGLSPDELQKCHLAVNELAGNGAEVDLDCEFLVWIGNVVCLCQDFYTL